MTTIRFTETSTSTPEQFIAALTDFGPGRAQLFANSSDAYLKVHDQGPGHADVTEGSNRIWERLRYDWSDPEHVVLTTSDSNLWGGASGHTYTFTRRADGKTDIHAVVVREGKNVRGRLLEFLLRLLGRRILGRAFAGTVAAVDARGAGPDPDASERS